MQECSSYIKDTAHFEDKITNLHVAKDALLVTAHFAGLYPNMPHNTG